MTDSERITLLEATIRQLRKALYYYARPGWHEAEHADAFEESRDVLPCDEAEDREYD